MVPCRRKMWGVVVVTLSVEVARAWRLGGVGVARCGGVARRLSAISKEAEAYLAEARKLRAEAARLEAELAAMRAREIDRVFEWAEPVDGKVTAAGLQRALTRHFVEENWNERDAARAAGVLESVERLERFASTRSSDGLLRRHDLDTPSAMRLELERLRRLEHRPRRREAAARRDDEPRERAILAFERQANRTGAVARLGAVACYVLPTLEGAAWTASCFDGVPLISAVFDSLAAAYRAVSPLGPLAGLVVVVNLALAVSTPRLVRFAANHAVVLDLLAALGSRPGRSPAELYASVAPDHGASIGMHMRHSLDHCARVADALGSSETPTLRYDTRDRGTTVETDPALAVARVRAIRDSVVGAIAADATIVERRVVAEFALSATESLHEMPSTVERELAFVAHHAYHHLALIRLIALSHLDIPESDLPPKLGRAPSTLIFDAANAQ
mmetsp:Transcript_23287/g.72934  ORF Transcript_23287/g.72934 Transcript_23287/m.72934 type:complete len:446 (+) Transcript_23287:174-1511(+)